MQQHLAGFFLPGREWSGLGWEGWKAWPAEALFTKSPKWQEPHCGPGRRELWVQQRSDGVGAEGLQGSCGGSTGILRAPLETQNEKK